MKKIIDLTGQRFERLIVMQRDGVSKSGQAMWLCKCDCGNTKRIAGYHLKAGHTRSCGCLWQETIISKITIHNMHKTSTYNTWKALRQRCYNKKNPSFRLYGGRGITICKRWEKFENFYADMGEKPKGMTLDRRNNSKGYSKSNCWWATYRTQANNKRCNCILTFRGRAQTIAEWGYEMGINYNTLWNRLNTFKWSVERALTEPVNK
jgi:hypothetical protein